MPRDRARRAAAAARPGAPPGAVQRGLPRRRVPPSRASVPAAQQGSPGQGGQHRSLWHDRPSNTVVVTLPDACNGRLWRQHVACSATQPPLTDRACGGCRFASWSLHAAVVSPPWVDRPGPSMAPGRSHVIGDVDLPNRVWARRADMRDWRSAMSATSWLRCMRSAGMSQPVFRAVLARTDHPRTFPRPNERPRHRRPSPETARPPLCGSATGDPTMLPRIPAALPVRHPFAYQAAAARCPTTDPGHQAGRRTGDSPFNDEAYANRFDPRGRNPRGGAGR